MRRIRTEVEKEIEGSGKKMPKYLPPQEKLSDGSLQPILYSEELNYLNAHWNEWSEAEEFTSHRPIVGKFIVRLKRKLRSFLVESLLKGYFERERAFQMNLVRHLNSTARYVDARDAEIFWQLVGKVDNDITSMNERSDRLFHEAVLHSDKNSRSRGNV